MRFVLNSPGRVVDSRGEPGPFVIIEDFRRPANASIGFEVEDGQRSVHVELTAQEVSRLHRALTMVQPVALRA